MTFTSYAQNFEDVMLWRAFSNISDGFYIDVGANHPDIDSVTKAFYDKGWSGINIEPVDKEFELLREGRVRDLNLNVAVGSEPGSMQIFTFPGTGLSTFDSDNAQANVAAGHQMLERNIEVLTLVDIFNRYVSRTVDFLKIDVEGWEKNVLLGADFKTFRPKIVLIESTIPGSQQSNHESWEWMLVDADYKFVWFDGLNRFYIANEYFGDLSRNFITPPNIFDGFISHAFAEAGKSEEIWLRAEWTAAITKIEAIQTECKALSAERNWLQSEWKGSQVQMEALRFDRDSITADRDWLRSEWEASVAKIEAIQSEYHAERNWLRTEWAASVAQIEAIQSEFHSERNWLRSEWDAALVQKTAIEVERDALIIERNALSAQIDSALQQKNAVENERDALKAERDEMQKLSAIYHSRVEAHYQMVKRSFGWKMAWPLRLLRIDPHLKRPTMPERGSV